jgi:hypothetical protein
MVAAQTTMKRRDPSVELEAADDLDQLLQRVERAGAVAMSHNLSHEKAPVASEQDALLPLENLRQFLVIRIVAIEAIKSQHSQIGSQPSQVAIKQEARLNRTSVFDGMDFHFVTVLSDRIGRSLPSLDLHPADLRMRHPQGLNQVLESGSFALFARAAKNLSVSRETENTRCSHVDSIRPLYSVVWLTLMAKHLCYN